MSSIKESLIEHLDYINKKGILSNFWAVEQKNVSSVVRWDDNLSDQLKTKIKQKICQTTSTPISVSLSCAGVSLVQQHDGSTCKSKFKVARGRRHFNLHTNSVTLLFAGWGTQYTLRANHHRPTDLPVWWQWRPYTWKHKQSGAFAYDLCSKGNARHHVCRTVAWVGWARENLNQSFLSLRAIRAWHIQYSTHTYRHTREHAHKLCTYIYKQWTQLFGLEKGLSKGNWVLNI